MLFSKDLCLTEVGQLIWNVNELTDSYIMQTFIEKYFQEEQCGLFVNTFL